MSISSVKQIQKRTLEFCKTINKWCSTNKLFNKINKILNTEYRKIPERERIGKGIKFISNQVAKGVFQCLKKGGKTDIKFIINFIGSGFNYGESEESSIMQHFVLHLIAEYISSYPEKFDDLVPLIINYACYSDWAIRETTIVVSHKTGEFIFFTILIFTGTVLLICGPFKIYLSRETKTLGI